MHITVAEVREVHSFYTPTEQIIPHKSPEVADITYTNHNHLATMTTVYITASYNHQPQLL